MRVLVATVVALSLFVGAVRALPPASVDVQDSKYLPPALTVAPGTTVRWTNRDEETHTVTSATGLFGSAGLDLGEAYTYTFTAPGVYPYTCDLHPFMQGTIVVK
jgi:plastocyanin